MRHMRQLYYSIPLSMGFANGMPLREDTPFCSERNNCSPPQGPSSLPPSRIVRFDYFI